jgi:plasmid stabilization system protein ParE
MSNKIHLLSHAKADLHEARNYYDLVVPRLGQRFIKDFESIIAKIEDNPFSYSSRLEGFRTANLAIFPYQVHYLIEEASKQVIIFGVLHAHRDPNYISSRFGK